MTVRGFAKIGLALAIGAAVALPAGFVLGRLGSPDEPARPAASGDAAMRDMYSPAIRTDRYFLARQREGVEALERHCAQTGDDCALARAARQRLEQLGVTD